MGVEMRDVIEEEKPEKASNATGLIAIAIAIVVLGFFATIVGLAFAHVDVTLIVIGLGGLLTILGTSIPGLLAYLQAKDNRAEQRVQSMKLAIIGKQVDGMTTKAVTAEGERAGAVATVVERDRGEAVAIEVKIASDAALADAQAAPTVGGAVQDVNIINSQPVPVDVITPVVPVEVIDPVKKD